jgi:hypothetical protein
VKLNQELVGQGVGVNLTYMAASCGVIHTYLLSVSAQKGELTIVLTVVALRSCSFVPSNHHNFGRGECRVAQTNAAEICGIVPN